jgi:hypothetical protein
MSRTYIKPHSEQIIRLYDSGQHDCAILAERCSVPVNTVRKCLIRHGRIKTNRPAGRIGNKRMVQVRVPDAIIEAARRRGTHPNRLVNALISVIARENLINAVMDDDEDETTWEPIGKAATRVVENLARDWGKGNEQITEDATIRGCLLGRHNASHDGGTRRIPAAVNGDVAARRNRP